MSVTNADVEAIAVEVATGYEANFGAEVTDVSKPELARRAGLTDWPGFDLKSRHPAGADGSVEERAIEGQGARRFWACPYLRKRMGARLQPAGRLLALRGLRLGNVTTTPGTGARSVRQTPRPQP